MRFLIKSLFTICMLNMLFDSARASEDNPVLPRITLEEAHRLAVQNNPSMKNLDETEYQARIIRWRAWSMLLPSLVVDGSVTLNDKEIPFEFPDMVSLIDAIVAERLGQPVPPVNPGQRIIIQERWGKRFGVTASMTLFNAQSIPLIQNAYDHIEATQLQSLHQKQEMLFAVTATYYGLRSGEQARSMAAENLKTSQEFLRLAQARMEVGNAVKVEVLQAEIAVKEAQKKLQEAEDTITLGRNALAYLIGIQGRFQITDPTSPVPVGDDIQKLHQLMLGERADLQAVRTQITMADRAKTHTWTKWVPNLDVTYNYNWDAATGFAGEHGSWRVIFGATWNILDGGQKIVELYERDSQLRQARYQYDQLLLNIKEEIEKFTIEMEQAHRNLEFAKQQLSLAEESHRLVSKQYQAGVASGLDLLEATNTLSQSRLALVMEELNRDLSILRLNRSVGISPYRLSR